MSIRTSIRPILIINYRFGHREIDSETYFSAGFWQGSRQTNTVTDMDPFYYNDPYCVSFWLAFEKSFWGSGERTYTATTTARIAQYGPSGGPFSEPEENFQKI